MNKSIPPYVLILAGLLLWASYYVIGGLVGSTFALLGLLLFLFGVAGLFRHKKLESYDEVIVALNQIKHSEAPLRQRKSKSTQLIKNSSLSEAEKHDLLQLSEEVYNAPDEN